MSTSLRSVFEGWDGYQTSLIRALEPLTPAQLRFRPGEQMRSVGEIFAHIALGRVDWFARMDAPGAMKLVKKIEEICDARGRLADESDYEDSKRLGGLLEESWEMVDGVLGEWTVDDIWQTYHQPYQGKIFEVSRQWVLWRIMCHDVHHGGQITILLGMQGLSPLELSDLGGHITEPPVVG